MLRSTMVLIRPRKVAEIFLNVLAICGLVLFSHQVIFTVLFLQKTLNVGYTIDTLSTRSSDLYRLDSQREESFVVHRWLYLCGLTSLRKLYRSSLFPKYPDDSIVARQPSFRYSQNRKVGIGIRLSGFLKVPESGFYTFSLNSTGMSELWLKFDNSSFVKISKSKPISSDILAAQDNTLSELFMEEERFYRFEVFHVGKFVEVMWLEPGARIFTAIESKYTSHDTESYRHDVLAFMLDKENNSFDYHTQIGRYYFVSFIPKWVRDSAIQGCEVLAKEKAIKPKSNNPLELNLKTLYEDFSGEKKDLWMRFPEIRDIVLLYMDALERIYPLKYRVKRLYKIEKLSHIENWGPHYVIHLEFVVDGLDYKQRVIEYVHQANSTTLCQPLHLKWYRDAVINVIIVIQARQKAIRRFIEMFERVFERSLEVDLHLIIVKYGRSGINVSAMLQRTSLRNRYTVAQMDGSFSKSRGMNKGASLAKGGHHAIILTCDVHMDFPDTLFEDTRTHTIQGHMVFSPVVFQLECGEDPATFNPRGRWCYQNYGIIGIYKTDWENISGMDETHFGRKGDWGLIQSIRKSGLTVVRHTYPGLFRYYTPYRGEFFRNYSAPIDAGFLDKDDK